MRKINWEGNEPLSEEDMRFIVQAGVPGWIERAERHQARFDQPMIDTSGGVDEATRYADDPAARTAEQVPSSGAPVLVTPDAPPPPAEVEDDYEEWKVADLETEVANRNELPNTGQVTVVGTGRDGKVLKGDLIKGLRLWDQDNPEV